MEVYTQPTGPVQANCYIVTDQGKALVIDPGDDASVIENIVKAHQVEVEAIVLTHAHFDHCGAVDTLAELWHCPVYVNPAEAEFLSNPNKNSSSLFGLPSLILKTRPEVLKEGEQTIGSFDVKAYYAPGHSIGSTMLLIGKNLFTGDILFQGSIGRTDLPTGNADQMKESLERIKSLPGDLMVYPGHGPVTTLEREMKTNPYLLYSLF